MDNNIGNVDAYDAIQYKELVRDVAEFDERVGRLRKEIRENFGVGTRYDPDTGELLLLTEGSPSSDALISARNYVTEHAEEAYVTGTAFV